jgi:hypothetical protein
MDEVQAARRLSESQAQQAPAAEADRQTSGLPAIVQRLVAAEGAVGPLREDRQTCEACVVAAKAARPVHQGAMDCWADRGIAAGIAL